MAFPDENAARAPKAPGAPEALGSAAAPTMPVAEMFISVNGEGQNAGRPAAFVRFAGCNLDCSYCDTVWANEPDVPFERLSVDQIVAFVRDAQVRFVTLTGGEPALQPLLPQLISALMAERGPRGAGLFVELETNGAVDLAPLIELRGELYLDKRTAQSSLGFTVDYKLPSSGQEDQMLASNFELLGPMDTVKFVCGSQTDLERALEVSWRFDFPRFCRVYFSPVFGQIEPASIVDFVLEHHMDWATVQLQLHKLIWPGVEKGV